MQEGVQLLERQSQDALHAWGRHARRLGNFVVAVASEARKLERLPLLPWEAGEGISHGAPNVCSGRVPPWIGRWRAVSAIRQLGTSPGPALTAPQKVQGEMADGRYDMTAQRLALRVIAVGMLPQPHEALEHNILCACPISEHPDGD